MLIELNRSYEARFLGREVLTAAVTSELLCRLVHQLPESVQEGSRCTVSCSASGLFVTRIQDGSVHCILRVPLHNILFCHVDKAQPEVTVWVVRTEDGVARPSHPGSGQSACQLESGSGASSGSVLSAYIYKCLNPSDAVGLFNVYNEMNRQAKLDKYRRNVEKKEDMLALTGDISKDSDSDDSHAGSSSSSGVSSGSNTSLTPVVSGNVPKVCDRPEANGTRALATHSSDTSADSNFIQYPTWTSITDSIENYRRSFGALRPRDKEARAAVLQELREKLRARYAVDASDRDLGGTQVQAKRSIAPVAETSNLTSPGCSSKQLACNRQRKPAKTIGPVPTSKHEKRTLDSSPTPWASSAGSDPAPKVLPFPFSMRNMMKRLVLKNRTGKGCAMTSSSMPPVQGPLWMLSVKGPITAPPQAPIANHSPTRKFKSKKGPAPLPPQPNIPPRMASNGVDPYYYLPPITRSPITKGTAMGAGRTDIFVPVLPQAWIHHHHPKETTIPETPGGKDVKNGRAGKILSNGDHQRRSAIVVSPKKKVLSVHGLSRFTRAYKKRMPHHSSGGAAGNGAFHRSSSTTSRDSSSSSESGPDGKLRSVMKKPKEIWDDTSHPEQKKNVTFHAYATVQVLP